MAETFPLKIYPIMILGTFGAALGTGIVLYRFNWTEESEKFVRSPEFVVWLFLMVVLMILFFTLPFSIFNDLQHLKPYLARNIKGLIASSSMMAILTFAPLFVVQYLWAPIDHHPLVLYLTKIALILAIGFITTILPASIGIWLVHAGLRNAFKEIQPNDEQLQLYLLFRDRLQRLILILGTAVGIATLGTGAARKALIAWGVSVESYPVSIVLVYGAYYTLIVGLIYLPTFALLTKIGHHLCDTLFPISLQDPAYWTDIYPKRKNLEEILQLHTTTLQSLQGNIPIFAPLLSAIIATLLG